MIEVHDIIAGQSKTIKETTDKLEEQMNQRLEQELQKVIGKNTELLEWVAGQGKETQLLVLDRMEALEINFNHID